MTNVRTGRASVWAGAFRRMLFAAVAAMGYVAHGGELPAEYERLPSIGSTGTQYINTKVVPNGAKVRVFAKYRFTQTDTYAYAFGYHDNRSGRGYGTAVGMNSGVIRYRVCRNTGSCGQADLVTHEVSLNGAGGTVIDGRVVSTEMAEVPDEGTMEYYAFGRNWNEGSGDVFQGAHVRIYRLTIELDGHPERDFVPCRRKSDRELGLYDLVNGRFYGNDGTGTFEAPLSEEEFKRDYIPVKYIQNECVDPKNHLGSYIRTYLLPGGHVPQVDITYRLVSGTMAASSSYVFGYWDEPTSMGTGIGYQDDDGGTGRYRVYDTAGDFGKVDAEVHTVSLNGPKGTYVGDEVALPDIKDVRDEGDVEYLVFVRNLRWTADRMYQEVNDVYQVYSLTIRQDGELVRDFVPCVRRSDGEPGLFDRVEGCFYGNSGSGRLYAVVDESNIAILPCLESSGSQYIRTGVVPNGATPEVEATYQYTDEQLKKNRGYLFGNWNPNSTGTAIGYQLPSGESTPKGRYRVYDKAAWYGKPDADWHTAVLNAVGGTTVDGAEVTGEDGNPIKQVADSGNVEYFVFARNNNGNVQDQVSARLKRLKIRLDGKLVRDFVPAAIKGIRLEDQPLFLYDRVTGWLFGNSGTGSFKSTVSESMIQRLRYVESTGTQYIDTRISANGCKPVVRMNYQMTDTTDNKYVFGAWNGSSGTAIGLYQSQIRFRVAGTAAFYGTADTTKHTIVLNAADGTSIDTKPTGSAVRGLADPESTLSYYLFARNKNGSADCSKARIYSFVLELDGKTVLDLVPARRKLDGVVGLWDQQTERFYTPKGGDLIAGPEVKRGLVIFLSLSCDRGHVEGDSTRGLSQDIASIKLM